MVKEFQQNWLGIDLKAKGEKWEMLTARATPDEKRDIYLCCQGQIGLKYSVITRIIWRRILYRFKTYPSEMRREAIQEVEQAVDEVMEYIPVIRKQRNFIRQF